MNGCAPIAVDAGAAAVPICACGRWPAPTECGRRTLCLPRKCSRPPPCRHAAAQAPEPAPVRCLNLHEFGRGRLRRGGSVRRASATRGRDADAGVAHGELDMRCRLCAADRDLALEGELEGVRDQIEDDLLPHVAIDIGRLGERRAVDVEPQSGRLDGRAKDAGKLRRESGKVGRLVGRPDAAGFDARKIEQRIDELEQPQTVALRRIDVLIAAAIARRRCANSRFNSSKGQASA